MRAALEFTSGCVFDLRLDRSIDKEGSRIENKSERNAFIAVALIESQCVCCNYSSTYAGEIRIRKIPVLILRVPIEKK